MRSWNGKRPEVVPGVQFHVSPLGSCWGLLVSQYEIGTSFLLLPHTLAPCAACGHYDRPKCHADPFPNISHRCPVLTVEDRQCLHSPKDACYEDLRDKILGCGTGHQQLPRSPTTEIRQTLGNFPGSRGEVLPSPRVWRGHQQLSTRDWNLELHSNSAVTRA